MTFDLISPKTKLRRLGEMLRDILFPPVCANCRKAGKLMCSICLQQIEWIKEPICIYCGRAVIPSHKLCAQCKLHPLPLKQIRAATVFTEPISTVIHKLKYEGSFGLGEFLADLMIAAWDDWKTPIDFVIPIPLHPEREKKRGYNQSALLARRFSQQLGHDYAPAGLKRIRFTVPQVGLNAEERSKNVQDAFRVDGNQFVGKSVLLIDDVCTTGATLAAAAQSLLETGAISVSGYCLARAMQKNL